MAPIGDRFFEGMAQYLSENLSTDVRVVRGVDWRERERQFDRGELDLLWVCGLPYVRKFDRDREAARLIAAPVMAAPRYGDRPVYFSDLVVRADHPAGDLTDLTGARWAYNEPGSHSGFAVLLAELTRLSLTPGSFAEIIEAGSHEMALRLISDGKADFAAIDSTVLELEASRSPELISRLKVIATLGPSPIPPLVASRRLAPDLGTEVQAALLKMHRDASGRAALNAGRVKRFAHVSDSDYDPIREAYRLAKTITG